MKKVLSIVISAVMIASLVGCSNSNNNSSEYVAPTGTNESSEDERVTEALTEAATEVPTEGIGEKLSEYKPIDTFANGFIWVEYKKDQKGLMSDSGKIVYSVSKDAQTNPVLEDGYTFFNLKKISYIPIQLLIKREKKLLVYRIPMTKPLKYGLREMAYFWFHNNNPDLRI